MKPSPPARVLCLFSLFLASAQGYEIRFWTDNQDRKIEATLLRVEDQTVILKLKDGREVPYPLAKLSAADGQYLAANRTPPAETGKALNFDAPWPEIVKFSEDPEINTVEEDAEKKRFVYESANYRYVCDVRLAKLLVKGIAEYVATTPYRGGTFNVRGNQKDILEYVTAYGAKDRGGRALGKEIEMPALKSFMLQDYAGFQEDPQLGYGCGLLITTYFLHMDGDGDGKRIKAWSRKGVDFTFAKS